MESKTYIIYKVTNIINNKSYIGLTSRYFETRRYEHIYESKKNGVFKFHQALRKYPNDNFTWEILEDGLESIKIANEREIYYIKHFDSYFNGYNMTKGGGGRDNYNFSDESKNKMSKAKIGRTLSDRTKLKISKANKGKITSDETKLKLSIANIGKTHSDETKLLISKQLKGKKIGNKNPSAIVVEIFNQFGELKFMCNGNFEKICNENGLPSKALRKSYYNNGKPIYNGKTIKKTILLEKKNLLDGMQLR